MSDVPNKAEEEPLEMGGLILKPGARIGGYVFMREIGSGGMARVLLAKDPAGNLVALKVLRKSRFKTGLVRFRREFRALSRIHHPNVIRVETYGDLYGHPFIAMEYVDGPDLHSLIRSFRTWEPEKRWARVEEILLDLCRALSTIHRRGLVHRDLKPSNVLINREGVCKLTDFGIVKDLDPSQDPHLSTTLVGTWAYASPEQISGNPLDHRSDLYSLGVILFAMLTGKRPFVANDMAGYLALHRDRPAPAPRDVNRDIPEHLDEICRKLLQKAPRDRYQSAQEILYRLESTEQSAHPTAEGFDPELVGRELELELLANAVSGLTARRGGVIVIEGDDGSGKTRLLQAALERAKNLGIPLHSDAFSAKEPPFSVSMRLLQETLKELGPRAPKSLVEDLGSLVDDDSAEQQRKQGLYELAGQLQASVLEEGPRLIVLDDLHEAKPRELQLFTFLASTLVGKEEYPLLLIASLRPRANAAADAFASGEGLSLQPQQIEVGPLSREDVGAMLRKLIGESPGARLLAQRLHKETDGNAAVVVEYIRNLIAAGTIRPRPDGTHELTAQDDEIATGHLEIPHAVRQSTKARLDKLHKRERRLLEVLSVAKRELDVDVLLDVVEEDEEVVFEILGQLVSQGLLRERKTQEMVFYQIIHRTLSDVLYRDLDTERRAELHRKLAAALELHYAGNPSALEVVGEHYRAAGDAGRAYRYLVAAAVRCAERSLVIEAWELTDKAATLEGSAMADLPPQEFRRCRRDLLLVRANALYHQADWAEAELTYQAVLQLTEEDGDAKAATEARLKLATVARRRGRHEDSLKLAEQGLEAARRMHFREGVAEALHCMSALAWADGDVDECERLASEGLLVAQGPSLAERRAELLLALTAAQAIRGHIAAATSGLIEAEAIFRELRLKRPRCLALSNIAELLLWQGEPLAARQRAHAAIEIAREVDYKLGAVAAGRAMGLSAIDLGLYADAQPALQAAHKLAVEIDQAEEILACIVAFMLLNLEMGRLSEARQLGIEGLKVAERRDPEHNRPLILALLARADAPTDEIAAREELAEAYTELGELPVPKRTSVQLAAAAAHIALGEREAARKMARAVLQTASSRGFRLLLLEARAMLTHLTEGEEQRTHRQSGQELARDFAVPLPAEMARAFAKRAFLRWLQP